MIKEPRWADNAYLAADSGPHSVFFDPSALGDRVNFPAAVPSIPLAEFGGRQLLIRFFVQLNWFKESMEQVVGISVFLFPFWRNLSNVNCIEIEGSFSDFNTFLILFREKNEIRRDWMYRILVLEREKERERRY